MSPHSLSTGLRGYQILLVLLQNATFVYFFLYQSIFGMVYNLTYILKNIVYKINKYSKVVIKKELFPSGGSL